MLFADLTAEGYALIIAAVFAGLGGIMAAISSIVILILGFLERGRSADRAAAVEQVKLTLQQNTAKQDAHANKQDAKLDQVAAKVEEVHIATNSMKDELVKKTEVEALARGGREERSRAEKEVPHEAKPQASAPGDVAALSQAVAEVPEKTAEKVVAKIRDEKQTP